MPVEIVNHIQRDGQGVPLILVHGFPVDSRMWDRCVTAMMELSDAQEMVQFPIWTPDMPGAGGAPIIKLGEVGHVAEDGAYEQALDVMADAYVEMLHKAGYKQAIWAGLSMGGYLVLDIQRRHPEAVAGLALLDTKGDADKPASRANRLVIANECEQNNTTEPVMFFVDKSPKDSSIKQSEAYIAQFTEWIEQQAPEGIAWRERMAAGRPDLNDVFEQITAPSAVICGEQDPSSAPAVMKPIAEQMRNSEVVFTSIDDCGHFSAWEHPEDVADALLALVRRVQA
ncbi:alpha/beta hydrolase [Bifidobacterium dolichotidis]|uniref:Alpha/beta hydrolase n=1 Tax=Bifidobacterium dolichotidis TaxID=2306976 RepID=A0A430FRP2_9BIFI|nr:alpha/beta hydrolase [Bifidobacterium dolichotidis]RSX55539.1 alpha/beta hydrolase [Bifidobacterium dolichotidis]